MRSVWQYLILFVAVSLPALANPTPTDPQILIDTGGGSPGISTNINTVQPDGSSTLVFPFFNDLNDIVTSLTFNTTIKTQLTQDQINTGFTCPDQAHQGYFLSCGISYDKVTGALRYQFSGVNPPDGDDNFTISGDPEFGEYEGIPIGGHFEITLQGWTLAAAAGDNTLLFDTTLPQFKNEVTAAPEPSQLWLLAVASLLLVSVAGIVRRREKRNIPTA